MRREDFFTGEVLDSTSPFISESEAIQNASFGMSKYDYDPGTRIMSQPINLNPGGYGYNQQYQNPYFQQTGYYNQYQNPYYMAGNPALQYQQQMNQQQFAMQQQELQYFIKPVNFSGEYLPPMNYEEEIERLKMEYWNKEQELAAQSSVNNLNSGYNPFTGYTNYYGMPYTSNPYQYNSVNAEISRKIQEMQDAAKQARIDFNIHLSKLAHNYSGDKYNEADIYEIYNGKSVSCPGSRITYGELYEQNRFNNMIPFDNSSYYREFQAKVSKEFNSIIPKDSSLKDTFNNMGIVYANYELEEEEHRRKNGAVLYNSSDNSYKYFVREKAAERYASEKGLPLTKTIQNLDNSRSNNTQLFPTLSQNAKLCDDGTLNITCNFGSHAGQTYTVHNSQEAGYDQDRERFNKFLDTIPNSIYLDGPSASVLED